MIPTDLLFAAIPGLILFLYGIEQFSKEIQHAAGSRFRSLIAKLTQNRFKAALLGAAVTAIIQSSNATTLIVVGLVNAGTISFAQSLGVIVGSNVGTTLTAQLVALKFTSFAPVFIVLGFLIDLLGGRYKFVGKPIFYFGLVFFGLNIVSSTLEPLRDAPEVISLLSSLSNPLLALLAGILLTVLFQSSSVVTGLAVLFGLAGLLTLEQAVPVILGSNIGTTFAGLLAASRMDLHARRTAAAHTLFNVCAVLVILPFLGPFTQLVASLGGSTGQQVANAHLVFNIAAAILALSLLSQFKVLIERLVPGQEPEILFKTKYLPEKLPEDAGECMDLITRELRYSISLTTSIFDESLAILKTRDPGKFQRVLKLENVNDYLDERIEGALLELSKRKLSAREAKQTVLLVRMSNVTERLGDAGKDFGALSRNLVRSGLALSQRSTSALEKIYAKLKENVEIVAESAPSLSAAQIETMRSNDREIIQLINDGYGDHLEALQQENPQSGSLFIEMLSVIEAANAKAREVRKLCEMSARLE